MTLIQPQCPKCENTVFALKTIEPIDARYKMTAVCCARCGAVVGVTEYSDVGSLVLKLAAKLGVSL